VAVLETPCEEMALLDAVARALDDDTLEGGDDRDTIETDQGELS